MTRTAKYLYIKVTHCKSLLCKIITFVKAGQSWKLLLSFTREVQLLASGIISITFQAIPAGHPHNYSHHSSSSVWTA